MLETLYPLTLAFQWVTFLMWSTLVPGLGRPPASALDTSIAIEGSLPSEIGPDIA